MLRKDRTITNEPIVRVADGLLEGFQQDGLYKFYGVPYAAPSVGELRWSAPQPMKPWGGVRKAKAFGPMAYQISRNDMEVAGKTKDLTASEDCLYLNI